MPGPILVVEDDPLVRMYIVDALHTHGLTVSTAASANEALSLLTGDSAFSHMVTDVRMPGSMDGLALAQAVSERWPDIYIIVVSGQLAESIDAPAGAAVLSKPFGLSALLAAIDRGSAARALAQA